MMNLNHSKRTINQAKSAMSTKIYLMPEALLALTEDGLNTLIKQGDLIIYDQFNDTKYITRETFKDWLNLYFEFRMVNKSFEDPVCTYQILAVKDLT
jgi:hypothetical protein